MQQASILVVDDDSTLLYSIRKSLETDCLRVITASSASLGIQAMLDEAPTVILLDLRLRETSGLDVLREIRRLDTMIPVIMFTAFSTTAATIEATQAGTFDYLLKPVDLQKLKETVNRAVAYRLASLEAARSQPEPAVVSGVDVNMIGSSRPMQEVYKQIGRIASSNANVLILGESGTGKELAARAVHHYSKRLNGQFLAINCAALAETLLESELFGHERSAFTGADKRRIGKFEYANGGTIFLDEVADMSPVTQAKVLRLLQEQSFERLGGNETIKTDVRIVAATNRNLEAMVRQGKFREDLYYRLNVFCIQLPPLRDRLEDLPELVRFFAHSYREEFGKGLVHLEPRVLEVLRCHSWPGNMRELQSVIKYALAHAVGSIIHVEHLPSTIFPVANRADVAPPSDEIERLHALARRLLAEGDRDIYAKSITFLERNLIPLVLDHVKGNLQHACNYLGISRNTLKAKMREHGITIEQSILSTADSSHQLVTVSEV